MDWRLVLGRNILKLRNARGWTQADLAGEANLSVRFVGGVERAEENPTLDVLIQLASAFTVPLGALFEHS
ncbi:helix-turn-helix domain-containing protein [Brevundimonas sp. NPDC092305]|uniref:helix-turn-helix domain-containing protein n=1 Tax=Brevundimonas sp. NPDC092305 TaxID=3363957 RepID=UPI0037F672A1